MIQNLTKLSVKCSSYNCRTIGANAASLLLARTGADQIFCRDVACYVLCAASKSSPSYVFTLLARVLESRRGQTQLQKRRARAPAPHCAVCPAAVAHFLFFFAFFTDIPFL